MLKRKHLKTLVYGSLLMCVVSIYLLNEAIQSAFMTANDLDPNLHRTILDEINLNQQQVSVQTDRNTVTPINDTLFQLEGYGYSYAAGYKIPESKSIWTEVVPETVYILSAFYDNRDLKTYVRMIAAIHTDFQADLLCHFKGLKSSIAQKVYFHEMSENHNLPYGGWILNCEMPEITPSLCEVSLSASPLYSSTSEVSILTVFTVNASSSGQRLSNKRFAVCIPPLFGNFPVRKLVEFFEMTHILGADRVFVYVLTDNSEIRRVLKYYQQEGFAVVLPWYLPFSDVLVKNVTSKTRNYTIQMNSIWYNGQLLAANDCLYRTMSYFDFTLFTDIDEFLIPKSGLNNWEDVIRELPENNISGYSFKSAYFKPSKEEDLISLGSLRVSDFSPSRNKVMVYSKRVLDVGIHHVSRSTEAQRKYKTYRVPSNVAYIHHFRACQKERDLNCSRTVVDDTVRKKYKNVLVKAVETALKEINILHDKKRK